MLAKDTWRIFGPRFLESLTRENKSRGNLNAPKEWTEAVIKHTAALPKITDACLLRITYLLPRTHIPTNFPYGTDLDNLNKRFLDGLCKTVFSEARGHDSCVVAMETMKVIVEPDGDQVLARVQNLVSKQLLS